MADNKKAARARRLQMTHPELESAYEEMAKDEKRESEALELAEAAIRERATHY